MIDVLILNYNDSETTLKLVQEIEQYDCIDNILVVDNKSTDGSFEKMKSIEFSPKVSIVETDKNGGYGYGNNYGFRCLIQQFHSKRILVCNPDISIDEITIKALDNFLENHQDYLVVAPFMHDINNLRDYHTAYRIPRKIDYLVSMSLLLGKIFNRSYYSKEYLDDNRVVDVGAVAGSLYMIDISRIHTTEIYDENIFLYCEETILGLRARESGLKIALCTDIKFLHKHSTSISKTFDSEYKRRRLMLNSRKYLLREYYKANRFELIIADILGYISFLELRARLVIKR